MMNRNKPSPKIGIVETTQEADESARVIRDMSQEELYSKEQLLEQGIIQPGIEEEGIVNAFRALRTELLGKMKSYNSVLMVSSTKEGGGASFTATNLAAAFAFDRNKTVLLVDCNFKSPSLSEKLNVDPEYGLKDYINGHVSDVQQIVCSTPIARVRFISSGATWGAGDEYQEFFSEKMMTSFLEEVKNRYPDRVIILDAPPILESADSKILAELSDYLLIVLPYKGATGQEVEKTLKLVSREKIVGFVLNN